MFLITENQTNLIISTREDAMDFIFMLTEGDRTIAEWESVLDELAGVGLTHVGCKEVGIDADGLKAVVAKINGMGATSYIELVGTTAAESIRAAENAIAAGAHRVLGGVDPQAIQAACRDRVEYLPFPGRPEGHPTALGGTPEQVLADCARFTAMGCAGVDLLAYRATEADPLDLVRAARRTTDGYLAVAGSIASSEQLVALRDAGTDGFTVGTAVFDGSFFPEAASMSDRVSRILDAAAG